MPKVLVNQLAIHYQQHGEGPDVILVHGVTGNLSLWFMHILPALARKYRVTAYDLRGHGYSDRPPSGYTSDDMVKDLEGLVDHLKIERAFIVGHSFGGALALHFASLCPRQTAGVVVLDAGIPALLHLRRLSTSGEDKWQGWDLYKDDLDRLGVHTEEELVNVENAVRKSFYVPVQHGLRIGGNRQSDRLTRLIEETTILKEFRLVRDLTEEKISRIPCPTLGIYGSLSPYRAIGERLKEIMPDCKFLSVPGHGHFYPMKSPDILLELLDTFFQKHNSV
jgi:pimeloyl-ACP methyl ester carboxylesterase